MSFEKLLVLGVIAALLIGPTRLPAYASRLALAVRKLRTLADDTQRAVREEVGDAVDVDWRSFDPRQYEPRRIIRDALLAGRVLAEPLLAEPAPAGQAPDRLERDAPARGHPRGVVVTRRGARMTLAAHLSELRRRAARSAAALLAGTVGGWFVSPLLLGARNHMATPKRR